MVQVEVQCWRQGAAHERGVVETLHVVGGRRLDNRGILNTRVKVAGTLLRKVNERVTTDELAHGMNIPKHR